MHLPLDWRWWAKRTITKMIRANLMLGWIKENLDCYIIYMLRHPCAVALSRKKKGWSSHLARFLGQDQLINDYLSPFLDLIGAQSDIEKYATMWAIENLVPLKQLKKYDFTICFYEELLEHPVRELARLFTSINLEMPDRTKKKLNKPSQVTDKEEFQGILSKWKRELSADEIDTIQGIVRQFNIEIYSEGCLPDRSELP